VGRKGGYDTHLRVGSELLRRELLPLSWSINRRTESVFIHHTVPRLTERTVDMRLGCGWYVKLRQLAPIRRRDLLLSENPGASVSRLSQQAGDLGRLEDGLFAGFEG